MSALCPLRSVFRSYLGTGVKTVRYDDDHLDVLNSRGVWDQSRWSIIFDVTCVCVVHEWMDECITCVEQRALRYGNGTVVFRVLIRGCCCVEHLVYHRCHACLRWLCGHIVTISVRIFTITFRTALICAKNNFSLVIFVSKRSAAPFSRTSVGLDLTAAMLGSEGCLGIITSVVIKVVPLPEVSEHASYFFRNFSVSEWVSEVIIIFFFGGCWQKTQAVFFSG